MADFPHTVILGIPIHMTTLEQAVAWAERAIRDRVPATVCHVNVHSLITAQDDPALRQALTHAGLAACDGMPLVWVGRRRGFSAGRVYGPDFMRAMLAAAGERPYRHFLYGSTPEVLDALTAAIARVHPHAVICGTISPPFRPLTPEEETHYRTEIDAARPDIVWVGIGAPRQEIWLDRNRPFLDAPLLVGVGAAFDFLAGLKPQAPAWIQNMGLEWLYRWISEPRRLTGRYLSTIPRFVAAILREDVTARLAGRK